MRKSTSPGFLQQSVWISLSRWGVASKPFEGSSQLCRGEPSKLFLKERKIWALLQFHVFWWLFDLNFLRLVFILTFFRVVFIANFLGWFSISFFHQAGFQLQLFQAGFQLATMVFGKEHSITRLTWQQRRKDPIACFERETDWGRKKVGNEEEFYLRANFIWFESAHQILVNLNT